MNRAISDSNLMLFVLVLIDKSGRTTIHLGSIISHSTEDFAVDPDALLVPKWLSITKRLVVRVLGG